MGRKGKAKAGGYGEAGQQQVARTSVTQEDVEAFLKQVTKKLKSADTRKSLKNNVSGKSGMTLMNEVQDSTWDELGIHRMAGRHFVENLEEIFPKESHQKLLDLRRQFAKASDETYWNFLEDRRPETLDTRRELQRNTQLDFYTACCTMLSRKETKDKLYAYIEKSGLFPDDIVTEVLGDVLELLGVERSHGQACLKKVTSTKAFQEDQDLQRAHRRWSGTVEDECLQLMRKYQKKGGKINSGPVVVAKLLEMQAKDELDAMTTEQKKELWENNLKKLQVVQNLPPPARIQYIEKLTHEEKVTLAKIEILYNTIMDQQQQMQRHQQQMQFAQLASGLTAERDAKAESVD